MALCKTLTLSGILPGTKTIRQMMADTFRKNFEKGNLFYDCFHPLP